MGQENGVFDAIALEQQLLDVQYQDIDDVDRLKEIIETLKLELKHSRMSEIKIKNTSNINVNRLKEETIDLESELVNERHETQKYKHLLHISQQLENINPDILKEENSTFYQNNDDIDRILQSKLDLVANLSKEFDRMRGIIKQQQHQIDIFNNDTT